MNLITKNSNNDNKEDVLILTLVDMIYNLMVQNLAVLESMQLTLENVVSAVYDGANEYEGSDSEIQLSLGRTFEGFPMTCSSYIIKN